MGAETFHGDPRTELKLNPLGQARAAVIENLFAQLFPGCDEMGDPGMTISFPEFSRIISVAVDQLSRQGVINANNEQAIELTQKMENKLGPAHFRGQSEFFMEDAPIEIKAARVGLTGDFSASDLGRLTDSILLESHKQGLTNQEN